MSQAARRPAVLDTNIVLDVWVFNDPQAVDLRQDVESGRLRWLATVPMREELARVLGYAHLARRLAFYGLGVDQILSHFDRYAVLVDVAPKAAWTCKDEDDQKFIDLAVAHRAWLLSKDKEVLCMRKRLLVADVHAQAVYCLPMADSV
jgi:putative PIN family toxin of toxin-antitoxin system